MAENNAAAIKNVNGAESLKSKIERAFAPRSGQGAVFMADNGDGTLSAIFACIKDDLGQAISYKVDGRVYAEPMLAAMAGGLGTSREQLKSNDGFHRMMAYSVAAAACSGTRIPGVTPTGCTIGPVMDSCKRFARNHSVEAVEIANIKKARNIAWRFRKLTAPAPVEEITSLI